MATVHGIPLLSDSPPAIESDACRKCNKEFNLFFSRSRKCNHCGYSYCHSCSDFQALLPRSGSGSGYDSVHVCGYCIELLNVTAAGPGRLRGMPLSKLKMYANSYNIDISRAVEKNDIIEAILNARGPNGCLPQSKEDFYRKNKVPNPHSGSRPRGFFSRSNAGNPPSVPPRPPPPQGRSGGRDVPNPRPQYPQPQAPHTHYQPSYAASPQEHPYQPYTPPRNQPQHQPQQQYNAPPHHNFQHQPPPPQPPRETRPRPPSRSNSAAGNRSSRPPPRPRTPPRQRTTSSPSQPPPHSPPAPVPTPTLDQLLVMTQSSIAALSVSVLKSILFMNHVNVTMVLEKSELVKKVVALVDDEKRERERQRMAEEAERFEEEERRREREEAIRREEEEREERLRKERQRNHRATVEDVEEGIDEMLDVEVDTVMDEDEDDDENEVDVHQGSSSANSQPKISISSSPNHSIPAAVLERSGLCVICQDEEANIAIVDCGHMVMCRACSELIMHGSRECPLCRTRIVTEARLLRIFKS
ncbi:hypothetical protein Agabi119p4_8151 [Agaricus bisporus var. burnettii]|uniref:RING-type domain-containing protein n=1 Tax=Agaricus bisporus var. burnettii TaxID=192524 RepID=A0A8H7C6I6_AGABI|nr:hypothetical protein Agabi119p4_8151 [Agaricus bisporus var. burnettii]